MRVGIFIAIGVVVIGGITFLGIHAVRKMLKLVDDLL